MQLCDGFLPIICIPLTRTAPQQSLHGKHQVNPLWTTSLTAVPLWGCAPSEAAPFLVRTRKGPIGRASQEAGLAGEEGTQVTSPLLPALLLFIKHFHSYWRKTWYDRLAIFLWYLAFVKASAWLGLKKASNVQIIFSCSQGHSLSLLGCKSPDILCLKLMLPAKKDIQAQS